MIIEITSFSEVTTYLPAVNWSGVFSTGLTTPAPLSICHRLDPRKAPRHRERRGILKLVPAGSFTTWRHSTPVAGLLPLKAWSRCERWPDTPLLKSNIFPLRKKMLGNKCTRKLSFERVWLFLFLFFPHWPLERLVRGFLWKCDFVDSPRGYLSSLNPSDVTLLFVFSPKLPPFILELQKKKKKKFWADPQRGAKHDENRSETSWMWVFSSVLL